LSNISGAPGQLTVLSPSTGVTVLVGVNEAVAVGVGGTGVLVRVGGISVKVWEGEIFVAGILVTVCGGRVTISVGLEHAAIKEIINPIHSTKQNILRNIFPPFDLGMPQIIQLLNTIAFSRVNFNRMSKSVYSTRDVNVIILGGISLLD
jgi:hypothetical protein